MTQITLVPLEGEISHDEETTPQPPDFEIADRIVRRYLKRDGFTVLETDEFRNELGDAQQLLLDIACALRNARR